MTHQLAMRRASAPAALILGLLVWSGCTAGNIPVAYSEYREGENFRGYKHFALLEGTSEAQRNTQPAEHELHELIERELRNELERRGYSAAGHANADFLVTFHCRTQEALSTAIIDREWYFEADDLYVKPVTPRHVLSPIREGSIIIDFASPDTHRRTWRGVARGTILPDASEAELEKIVVRSIRETLDEFPPPG